jgi:tRNA A37 methylthiotransferase MiaB
MKVYVKGLNSCIQRKADIRRYKDYVAGCGHELVDHVEQADRVLLWTCAFRADHKNNSLRKIKSYTQADKDLVVCGCLPGIDKDALDAGFDGVSFRWADEAEAMPRLFGGRSVAALQAASERAVEVPDFAAFRQDTTQYKVAHADQFVKLFVSYGCNQKCAYCSEILAFPPYRSVPLDQLVSECQRRLSVTGTRRVLLFADSLGEYGCDIGCTLIELIDALTALDGVQVGLENLNPCHFLDSFDPFIQRVHDGRIFLLQLPIQSASDRILDLMARKYHRADLERLFGALKECDFREIETHTIIGFPTEQEEDFNATVEFLSWMRPKIAALSAFMDAPNAPASGLQPKIPAAVIERRIAEAVKVLTAVGIVCNHDNCSLSQERFDRDLLDLA